MTTVLLVRHGRTRANAEGVLAGWSGGVRLDERGLAQAEALAQRVATAGVDGFVTSPLERCRQTTDLLSAAVAGVGRQVPVNTELDLAECRYGDWTGRRLADLAAEPMWQVVQQAPSMAQFPGGESLGAVQARAVEAVRRWNRRYGPTGLYVVVSHGDVIKAVVADALGMHLDMFQRIVVGPCSVTAIDYTPLRPFLLLLNDTGSDLSELRPGADRGADARVGGG